MKLSAYLLAEPSPVKIVFRVVALSGFALICMASIVAFHIPSTNKPALMLLALCPATALAVMEIAIQKRTKGPSEAPRQLTGDDNTIRQGGGGSEVPIEHPDVHKSEPGDLRKDVQVTVAKKEE